MKRTFFLTVCLLFVILAGAQKLFVGTYNVRNLNKGDIKNGNGWAVRRGALCDMINFEHPDIFGTQEALNQQLNDMRDLLDGYDYIGVGREDGKTGGEYSAVFYRKDKFKLLDSGTFWLNETPDVPKLGWDAACKRVCTWGKFKDTKSKLTFYFFNLHMDHIGIVARRESAKLVISKIKEITGLKNPFILTGDFNVDQNSEVFKIFSASGIMKDSYTYAKHRFAENGTFNDFNADVKTDSRIDHIFVSPKFEIMNYGILTNAYWAENPDATATQPADAPAEVKVKKFTKRTPSDHYPVFAKIIYDKK
jgi:endonuclease/exonuclease/phosphatase family metal-dependent hydrolase